MNSLKHLHSHLLQPKQHKVALIHLPSFRRALCYARQVFDEIPVRDLDPLNSLVPDLSQQSCLTRGAEVSADEVGAETSISPPTLPQNHDDLLLALLHRHQYNRGPSMQLHTRLITSALHRDRMDGTGILIVNALIRHYSLGCFPREAILFFKQMQDMCTSCLPTTTFTFNFLLKAAANLSQLGEGIQLHALAVKKGFEFHIYTQTALVNMYAACDSQMEARRVFDEMPERNSVSWNIMITSLIRWGDLGAAVTLFEQMPGRTVVSWTTMIDGYTRSHRLGEALALWSLMVAEGIKATEITVLAIVPAISNLGDLFMGESMHAYCRKRGLDVLDIRIKNSFIDMYAKCGSIANSMKVFEEMPSRRNVVSWTSIISGFAMHGMASEAVELFKKMEKLSVRPNRVTLLSVLSACGHGGLVEEGVRFFTSMVHVHRIEPEIKHYGCMIDMLGRAGRLGEAEQIIMGVPMEVNVVVWRTLLGCCSKHGDVEMGERVLRRILELEKGYGGDYVILSNMLTEVGRFGDAEMVRMLMDERNAMKLPGRSFVSQTN